MARGRRGAREDSAFRRRPSLRRRLLVLFILLVSAIVLGQGGRALWTVSAADIRARGTGPVFLDRFGERIVSRPADLQAYIPLDAISVHAREAIIAMEDARFWRHPGIDPVGIVRAALAYWRKEPVLQGASTITQQLAKNLFLTPERTIARKLREAFLAFALELRYSKNDLLELYLNRVYFGSGAYGIEAAARIYFNKGAADLNLGEAAMLAGLLPAPNRYSPLHNIDNALKRRRLVLERMASLGLVSREDADHHASVEPNLAPSRPDPNGYFTDYVTEKLVESLGPHLTFHGQLEVWTTLDPDVQRAAGEALARSGHQGAVIVMDVRSGDLLALVGGRDYKESQFNRAVHAYRQPGSAFKPLVYAAALERHWAPNSLLNDERQAFGSYRPSNWGNRYHGKVTMAYALAQSLNSGSVWLLRKIGPRAAMDMATRLGIPSLTGEDMHLALALGGLRHGVTPLHLAEAYSAFATGGVLRKGRAILHVRDREGREWPPGNGPAGSSPRVMSPQIAYIMTQMLEQVIQRGTGSAARLGVPAAGKTGSTNGNRDAWFVGYTPHYLGAVFIGYDDNSPLPGGGGDVAAPVWRAVMNSLVRRDDPRAFPVPRGVTEPIAIDIYTGLRAGGACSDTVYTAFIRGTEPAAWAPCSFEEPARHPADGDDAGRGTGEDPRRHDREDDGFGPLFFRRLLRPGPSPSSTDKSEAPGRSSAPEGLAGPGNATRLGAVGEHDFRENKSSAFEDAFHFEALPMP